VISIVPSKENRTWPSWGTVLIVTVIGHGRLAASAEAGRKVAATAGGTASNQTEDAAATAHSVAATDARMRQLMGLPHPSGRFGLLPPRGACG
jgi:hypothetical protein